MLLLGKQFFDTHCHLQHEAYDQDLQQVLSHCQEAQVDYMTVVGWDYPSSLQAVSLAQQYPGRIFAAVGVHPQDCLTWNAEIAADLFALAQKPCVVAIGEIGLDYYRDPSPKEVQAQVFIEQIHMAKELQKPIIIHSRDAHGPLFDIVKKEAAAQFGGIMHCYSGSVEMARQLLSSGWTISLAGPLTFKNARQLPEVVNFVPLDRLLIETDSPYMSPEPLLGKRNDPSRVTYIAGKIAEIKGVSLEEVANITTQNAKQIFHIV